MRVLQQMTNTGLEETVLQAKIMRKTALRAVFKVLSATLKHSCSAAI